MTILRSEEEVKQSIRLEAPRHGDHLFRNNVGACRDRTGRQIRYGLANDSKQLNEKIKSSDLIGIRPVLITPEMIGRTFGLFMSVETKREGWVWTGSDHEVAQKAWIDLIISLGGFGCFATSPEDVWNRRENR